MTWTAQQDYLLEVSKGNISGHAPFFLFGERTAVGTGTAGEDIWAGTAIKIPHPPDVGFKDVQALKDFGGHSQFSPPLYFPSLTIVKVTAWAIQAGATASASATGVLVDNGA